MAKTAFIEHDTNCGLCYQMSLMRDVAVELLKQKDGSIEKWNEEVKDRWKKSKYYKLYQKCIKEKKKPEKEFDKRGWEM